MYVVRKYLIINPLQQSVGLRILVFLLLSFSIVNCFSNPKNNNNKNEVVYLDSPDEIIFYSNGTVFSPVITLQAEAEVLWTWADNTTSNSLTPTKDYGSAQLRPNRLKVTPWSAVRRINIGYDAGDEGSVSIELVDDQQVSLVENLFLVAPYLKEWCSSYNDLIQLDFNNFTELETIECFLSTSLENVNLENTPKLKRVCFENNNLLDLNLSTSPVVEDLRAAQNAFNEITLSNQNDSLWHICVHHNQFSTQHFFSDMSKFPNIADLLIDYTNQQGELVIPKTHPTMNVEIRANGNNYTSIDLRGAFQNAYSWGIVDMDHNDISDVKITGCVQLRVLDLSYNQLESFMVDQVLKQMDDYGISTLSGRINLSNNQPPTFTGLIYKSNLEEKGWTVSTDENIPVESIEVTSNNGTTITTNNGTLQLLAEILPAEATTKTVVWAVLNETGQATITSSGLLTAEKNGTVRAVATASDGSGITGEIVITITNQIIPLESINVNGSNTIDIDNGTLQLIAEIVPADATYNTVVWSVVNETGQASINSSGLLTAEKDGTVKAIATATDGSGITGELQITISNQLIQVENIIVSGGTAIITDNGTLQLLVDILPIDATNKTVNWSVINETGQASINSSGLLTAEKDGTIKAVATATDGSDITGELQVNISNQFIPVESITVSGGALITTDNGILQLTANVFPTDATNKTVNWSVINETGQASINSSGLLTAEKDGIVKAVATATDGSDITGELQITISNQFISVESITISGGTAITTDNGTLQLLIDILPIDATNKMVNWSVQEETGKATISTSGLLSAEKDGTVIVIATVTDGTGIFGELQVTISNQIILMESISIAGGSFISTDKGTLQLTANVLPSDATSNSVNWAVVNETGQASISLSGLLSAEKDGTVLVVATATDGSDIFGELQVTISNQIIPVEVISVSGGTAISTDNGTLQLTAHVLPADATTNLVVWSVINETGQASISSSGLLSAEKEGTIRVVATATDGTGVSGELQIIISNQIIPVESISITGGSFVSTDKGTLQLTANVLPLDATSNSVIWSVVDESGQASINSSGLLSAEQNGTVLVVATASDGSDIYCEIQITISNQEVLIENIEIISNLTSDSIIGIGVQVEFEVFILPNNVSNPEVYWSVENLTGEAIIDSSGTLTTLLPGIIRIIAKAKDDSKHKCTKDFIVAIPLYIEEKKNILSVNLFPNPTSGKIQIQIDHISSKGAYVEVRNVTGQLLLKKKIFEPISLLFIENYKGNIFFINIHNNENVTFHKIIKN